MVIAMIFAITFGGVVIGAEAVHQRRSRRSEALALGFGASGARRPSPWTRAVPAGRVAAMCLVVFGAVTLLQYRPEMLQTVRTDEHSQRILICLDVSPSMHVADAGAASAPITRAARVRHIVGPMLSSVNPSDTRVSVVAFYTRAVPLLVDTIDFDLVNNAIDGLPISTAFEAGETDLLGGVTESLQLARSWAPGSTTLVIVSDGDSNAGMLAPPRVPPSIAQTVVIGVGDTQRYSAIGNRKTRQDAASLRRLAAALGGEYIDGNRASLSPRYSRWLSMSPPEPPVSRRERNIAIACLSSGALIAVMIGPALAWFGSRGRLAQPSRIVNGGLS